MANELVEVPFHGGVIEATRDENGAAHVPIKQTCERIGLQYSAQLKRLKRHKDSWATMSTMDIVAADGKCRKTWMLHSDCVPIWLATVLASEVDEAVRPAIVCYQREARDALARWARGECSEQLPPSRPVPPSVPVACQSDAIIALATQVAELCRRVGEVPRRRRTRLRPVREVVRRLYFAQCPQDRMKLIVNEYAATYWDLFEHAPPPVGSQVGIARRHYNPLLEPIVNRHYEAWQEEKRQKELPFPVTPPPPAAPQLECPHPTQIIIVNPPPSA